MYQTIRKAGMAALKDSARAHILIVEDDDAIGEMLVMVLELEGYHVTWTRSVPETIALLAANAARHGNTRLTPVDNVRSPYPNLILLDLQLSGMDGAQMIKDLMQRTSALPPIIVVSAKRPVAVEDAAEAIGAMDVYFKPFDLPTLLGGIKSALARN